MSQKKEATESFGNGFASISLLPGGLKKSVLAQKKPCLAGATRLVFIMSGIKSINETRKFPIDSVIKNFGTLCKPHNLQMEPWEPPAHPQLSVAGTGTLVERPPSRLLALYTQIQIHINTNKKIQNTT